MPHTARVKTYDTRHTVNEKIKKPILTNASTLYQQSQRGCVKRKEIKYEDSLQIYFGHRGFDHRKRGSSRWSVD